MTIAVRPKRNLDAAAPSPWRKNPVGFERKKHRIEKAL
jgi:hypothetical protein